MRFFACGLLLAVSAVLQLAYVPSLKVILPGLAISLVFAFVWPKVRVLLAGVLLGVSVSCLGLYQLSLHQLSVGQVSADITLMVKVVGVPDHEHRRTGFEAIVLSCESCSRYFGPRRIQLSWYGAVRDIHAGETWRLGVRLKPLGGLRNPGSFDSVQWGLAKGLHARGYVRKNPLPVRISGASRFNISALRERQGNRLSSLPSADATVGLVQALTIGVKKDVAAEHWQLLRDTGTAHLLAISGLHIGLVASWGLLLGRLFGKFVLRCRTALGCESPDNSPVRLKKPRWAALLRLLEPDRLSLIAGFMSALAYAAVSGFELPVLRALLMLLVWVMAAWRFRYLPPAGGLALALIVILLNDVFSPLSVGFWLSFGTVAALFYLHSGRQVLSGGADSRVHWIWRRTFRLISLARTHLLLGLVLLPASAWFFQSGSLVAPVANLLAVPWVGVVVAPLCFLTLLTASILPDLATWALVLAQWSLGSLLSLLEWLHSSLDGTLVLSIRDTSALLLALIALLLLLAPRGTRLGWLALPLVLPALLFNTGRPALNGVELHVLDVGQGLAVLVFTPRQTLLFDTGGRISDSLSMVEAVVMPYLHKQGRRTIDTLVVSHGDEDHSAGVTDILLRFPDVSVFSSTSLPTIPSERITRCEAGNMWVVDTVNFSFLHPALGDEGSDNDLSCVMLIQLGASRILLTGDIEAPAELRLVQRMGRFPVNLMVAPHHGSRTSSSQGLLDHLQPRHVVFPAGNRNAYGFPHADVQMRYKLLGAQSYVTGTDGALVFAFSRSGLRRSPDSWRRSQRRFWHGIVNPDCSHLFGERPTVVRLLSVAQKGQTLCGK